MILHFDSKLFGCRGKARLAPTLFLNRFFCLRKRVKMAAQPIFFPAQPSTIPCAAVLGQKITTNGRFPTAYS
jgi:hypothetical protein